MNAPSFLNDPALKLLLFGGKGGVGKTTCAAATALRLARSRPDASFLLVSTDPAHSLADSLSGPTPAANLEVVEINAQEALEQFKAQHNHHLKEIASRGTFLDDDDISQFLDLSLPGMDELMAFLEICGWVTRGQYDCVVVDTAPAGHTLRLLAMPELMRGWLSALDALLAKHRYLRGLFKGSVDRDELDQFLDELSSRVQMTMTLLRDTNQCRFVPVVLAEHLSIRETLSLIRELRRLKVPIKDVVINRVYPSSECPVCASERNRQMLELENLFSRLRRCPSWGVPLYQAEVRGFERLAEFWENVTPLRNGSRTSSGPIPADDPIIVRSAADHPAPGMMLFVFAGKGGVGKTTLACATALRLAGQFPGKDVLLFSADPAHSLSACLGVEAGSRPTTISPGLTALEIDAQAEFAALKHEYRRELSSFLQSLLPNMDLSYDREVLERILDLSPPGLDEIMALDRIMQFHGEGTYDVIVLDAAPTGHLIRLLELPDIVDQWLKVFFGLFLKYKNIFRLPKIGERFVNMSKNLKRLRQLLLDHSRSAIYAVSILTDMSLLETQDLIAASRRMGLSVPVLFLNLATQNRSCPLCASLHHREQKLLQKFSETFPDLHQTLIYRQGDLRGLERLEELGQALYKPRRLAKDHI